MTGRTAVARELAAILSERRPGTVWLPVERSEVDADAGAGQPIRRLAAPENPHALRVEAAVTAVHGGAPDEHAVDAGVQETSPLIDVQLGPHCDALGANV